MRQTRPPLIVTAVSWAIVSVLFLLAIWFVSWQWFATGTLATILAAAVTADSHEDNHHE